MSTNLELLINDNLNELSQEAVADLVVDFIDSAESLSPDEVHSAFYFLLRAGAYPQFFQMVIKAFKYDKFAIPWDLLIEVLNLSSAPVDQKFLKAIISGITQENAGPDASRSQRFDRYHQEFKTWRQERATVVNTSIENQKLKLMDQLDYFRSQRLYEQEKRLLAKLFNMYPDDQAIQKLYKAHRERYADEILSKTSRHKSRTSKINLIDPEDKIFGKELSDSLKKEALNSPEMAYELAISAFIHEEFESGLEILKNAPQSSEAQWLRLEMMLGAKRFLEIINILPNIENAYSDDSETFFATAYYRALSLWGLGQKDLAIEVMESLLESRPNYRSGLSLLSQWKSL